ncbi:hypothetical protein OG884_01125 [Streptosporangium sp. NBC_01755]|nr:MULTISPECIES: hypothetical protein [unclassified Streptosporangium]WSA29810.1 hypothetical protein OIE13_08840 [Streptosporangium sp. NBC_01810]WSD04304.1 hypothetical protein OG884_01125 [Streptosporangium sp. NBC_01755]
MVARIPGDSPDALLIHGHLDVVPVEGLEFGVRVLDRLLTS